MTSLQSCLLREYREHPAFAFGAPSWQPDADAVSTFNRRYDGLVRFAGHLGSAGLAQARAEVVQALDAVFAPLQVQTADLLERRFLDELLQHCKQLITTEIDFLRVAQHHRTRWLEQPAARDGAVALHRERHFFGRLGADALAEVHAVAAADLQRLRDAARAGARTREQLSVNAGPTARAICSVLNRAFEADGVLDAVSAYAGCRMTVKGQALELSVPQSAWWGNSFEQLARPPHTLYAHLDESIDHPKAIVYLSDVAPDNGPTSLYPGAYEHLQVSPLQELVGRIVANVGHASDSPLHAHYSRRYHQSMGSENFRRHYMRLPDELRFNSHFGWDVLPDGDVEQFLTPRECKMLGPAGTYVVFDGARLLHRGGLIQSGERIALQVIFADAHLGRKVMKHLKKRAG